MVQEFNCRGDHDIADLKKDDLVERLKDTLKGVQRVPSLLLFNPRQHPSTLHHLKGHFTHLVTEVPYLLQGEKKQICEDISNNKTEKMTGAKYRITIIQLPIPERSRR